MDAFGSREGGGALRVKGLSKNKVIDSGWEGEAPAELYPPV